MDFQSNPFGTSWEFKFNTKTTTGYLQDVWTVTDALKVNFRLQGHRRSRTRSTRRSSAAVNGKIESKAGFPPQVGVVYDLNNGVELFGGYTENMAAYVSAATSGPFASQNQAVVDFVRDNLKPETSKTFEGGLRYKNDRFQGVAALYNVDFENRLDSASTAPPILGLPAVLSNVGAVKTKGVELAGQYRVTDAWSLYGSYAYNDSTYKDDVPGAGGTVAMQTKGKDVVFTPKHLFKAVLGYDNGPASTPTSASATPARAGTRSRTTAGTSTASPIADLSVGYRFDGGEHLAARPGHPGQHHQPDRRGLHLDGGFGRRLQGRPGRHGHDPAAGRPRRYYVTIRKQF